MMKKVSIIAVLLITLFVVNVSAGPLNSFEQNPIPYWDDLSTEVSLSWDSTEQTVTVSAYSIFWEDFSDISDWNSLNDPITTDGAIASITTSSDYVWDRWDCNTPDAEDWEGFNLKMRWKSNVTEDLKIAIAIRSGDDYTGEILYSQFYITPAVAGVWSVWEDTVTHDNAGDYESVSLLMRSYQNVRVDIDYIRVAEETGDLDLGVPITLQDSQEIELFVNSTFLNSEVRLEIYDDTNALDTYCVFNGSYVVFQDNESAQTNGLARIQFSLDNARKTGTITVFAENGSLINQYAATILSGTTFLRMIDSELNGAIILYYLNGDLTYSAELSIIEEFFLGTGMIGYLGPLALVFVGYLLVKKDKGLGIIAFIVEALVIAQYLALVGATPDYWWHIFILMFGMLFTVVFPLWDR